ncbi:hypothetical protein [Limnohabitans sp. TEGF004]|uniref:hypothetical protein n=1 Tax=Limnohabitans sp. TEGF004 TaxID=2986281 RepID=UPI00248FBF8D|nr:hypothetical protein [Limnohabitans sp. TEGF004]
MNTIFKSCITHKKKWRRNRLLVIPLEKWDCLISESSNMEFDLATYSYSDSLSNIARTGLQKNAKFHININTEFWGESLYKLTESIRDKYEVYGFLNGDIWTTVDDINKCFEIGDLYELDLFQPSLSHSSFFSHPHTLNDPKYTLKKAPWIEVMMPFFSNRMLKLYSEFGYWNYSGWGIDCYIWPYLIKKNSLNEPAIIHCSTALHCKPIESNQIVFKNGLTANQELAEVSNLNLN